MVSATQLQKRPATFQRLTGVTSDEFDAFVELLTPLWDAAQRERLNARERIRASGAGVQFTLDLSNQTLMTLIYLRQYCTQEFLGWLLFHLGKSNVCRNIALLLPILEQALPSPIRA